MHIMYIYIYIYHQSIAVPVGEDQLQHLELARKICNAFNDKFDCKVFTPPSPILTEGMKPYILTLYFLKDIDAIYIIIIFFSTL